MTLPPAAVTPAALALLAIGQLIYHAGPWPWASRSLSVAFVLLPLVVLALAMPCSRLARHSAFGSGMALVAVLLTTTLADPWRAYLPYQILFVVAQWLLLAVWLRWWLVMPTTDWLTALALLLTSAGAGIATSLHWVWGYAWQGSTPPGPWCPWRSGECGALDMASRIAPMLAGLEVSMVAAALVGVWWAWRKT